MSNTSDQYQQYQDNKTAYPPTIQQQIEDLRTNPNIDEATRALGIRSVVDNYYTTINDPSAPSY